MFYFEHLIKAPFEALQKPVSSDSSYEQYKYDEHENEDKEDNVDKAEYEDEDDEEDEDEDEEEDEEEEDEELKRIHNAMKQDNKDDFVELLNRRLSWDNKLQNSYWVLIRIYDANAVKCIAAILDGETKVSNIAACLGENPFRIAVCFRSDKITAFLLERGEYSANATYKYSFLTVLPLEYSLDHLSQERSNAVKFIINLFGECWSDQKKRMKMVGVFAPKTREIKQLLFHNLKEGNMVEVGGLLLFAKQYVLSTSIVEGEFQSISEMHDFLSDEISSSNTQRIYSGFNTKLKRKEETLLLLKILDKIGDQLSTLLQLNCFTYSAAMAVVSLIKHAGFDVKAEYLNNDSNWSRQLWYDVMKMDRENTTFTTYGLPSSPKAAAVRDGLFQKWGTISSLPVLSEALLKTKCVSTTTTLMACNPSITHLRKLSTVPFVGTLVKAFRRGFHF